jgi:hypothetical protein
LRALARDEAVAGRLQATAEIELHDLNDATDKRTGDGDFELLGPGDVLRLAPGTISRRYPAPGALDAEETKTALVEFGRADLIDLPWRYSPQTDRQIPGAGRGARPWMVLVVGTPGEVVVSTDGHVTLNAAAQAAHKLGDSWRWAHVHEVDGVRMARIVCARDLKRETYYTACVVPAFVVDADGAVHDAWPVAGGGAVTLPCYDAWVVPDRPGRRLPAARREAARRGFRASRAKGVRTRGGSLRSPRHRRSRLRDAVDGGRLAAAGACDAAGRRRMDRDRGRRARGAVADAGRPLGADLAAVPRTVRCAGRRADRRRMVGGDDRGSPRARRRGPRRLAAIAWQDDIARAAATKAGDLAIARERVGALALGVEASRSLWRRHVPTDPVEKLAVLAPVLGRLPVKGGGTALDAIAGRTPLFARALFSSAARRALRPSPARGALAKPGAQRFDAVLKHASRCPARPRDPSAIPLGRRVDAETQVDAARAAIRAAGASDPDLAREVADRLLGSGAPPSPSLLAAILAALDPGGRGRPDRDAVMRLVDSGRAPPLDVADFADQLERLRELGGRPLPCRDVDLDEFGRRISDAIDPTVARPLVVDRVLGTLTGVKDMGPVEIEPELDLPLWRFLADTSPDWLLPGVGELKEHEVAGLATHPAFVEAMLAGANHQALSELRWRNVPIASRWSPMRKFWHRKGGEHDIVPIKQWPGGTALGGAGLQPPGVGAEAVVVFRTPLFRRYPSTVVYLYSDDDWTPPPASAPLDASRKVFPSFTGRIGDDVVFFGFPVAPGALATHWVVLEEPPAGYRFRTESTSGGTLPAGATAAEFAYNRFALPVRVMIGKLIEDA